MQDQLLYPLTHFLAQDGRGLPPFVLLNEDEVPEPYRSLLVHDGDMTSRLEAFHGGALILEVLHREEERDVYRREVLLRMAESGVPVEYGAIEIDLAQFGPEVRAKIIEGRQPLGAVLNEHQFVYRSEPRAFVKIAASPAMTELFNGGTSVALYGRCNLLLSDHGAILARIVEVLPPHRPA